jgi:hypothetical protein
MNLRPIPNLDGYAARDDGTVWTEWKFRGRGSIGGCTRAANGVRFPVALMFTGIESSECRQPFQAMADRKNSTFTFWLQPRFMARALMECNADI